MDEPRTIVFICNCQGRLAESLDIEKLSAKAGEMSGVAKVINKNMICQKEESASLADAIKDAGADRVLFAGCSGRSSLRYPEKFLGRALARAGLSDSMFEIANIREQCALIHEPGEAATAKAMDEIRMANARLSHDRPRSPATPIEDRALVVGGGPAGLAAAQSLASVGREVTLVEQRSYLGGRLCQIPFLFQTERWTGRCVSICVGPVQAEAAVVEPEISAYTRSGVARIEKKNGNFEASLIIGAALVDPEKCTACGACAAACPETVAGGFEEGLFFRKAIDKDFARAVPDVYSIDEKACTRCGACVEACPVGAIDLDALPETRTETYGAVFLSTGFETTDPNERPEFAYPHPDVVTGLEFERLLDHGVARPSNGEAPEHIVFVLCAGSRATRDKKGKGVPYCSKTCCGVTMKQAERVALTMFETEVTIIYYYDVRAYERAFENCYSTVRRMGVDFVKGNIGEIKAGDGGGLVLSLDQLDDQAESSEGGYVFTDGHLDIKADMVVLASAQKSADSGQGLFEQLGLSLDSHGFPMENQPRIFRPTESYVDRVMVIGSAGGPVVVQQAVEQGKSAAMTALPALLKGQKESHRFESKIDPAQCISCRICESVCPHGAIRITEKGAYSDPAFCQGCGLCQAACPTRAARIPNFSDRHIIDQAKVAFGGVPEGDPKILALLCYWCSYCAADMGGIVGLRAPVNYRSIRIRCSSSIHSELIMELFSMGVDGILVAGCPPAGCHHKNGNYLADKRVTLLSRVLEQLGLAPERLRFEYIGVPQSQLFVDTVQKMDEALRKLGPNPAAALRGNRLEE